MNKELRIGMIGLDTSHCGLFTGLLNDSSHQHHVSGGRVTLAYPGGSADLHSSYSRVDGYTEEMRTKYGVSMAKTIEDVAGHSDAIFLTSVDGRVHLEQFAQIASYGKPVYINKPFVLSLRDAETIFELADKYKTAILSCSSLRYSDPLIQSLLPDERGQVIGADSFSCMPLEPTNPGWFWYGIHAVEMLYTALPTGCRKLRSYSDSRSEHVVGVWEDGRIGTVRGNRMDNHDYGITVHRESGSIAINPLGGSRPFYVNFVEEVMKMFQTGTTPLDPQITLEITRFMEAANESRISGAEVKIR
ncbi:Gfo/Idh/MocA family protein [Paenibacillus nasutitermitis]|uniref:Dehydrogenase n=1 Tax=Paenibacillus nasutitermitis TaxID=1652958 RepID=A0A916YM93_9BACL|nr:Gfo/Idh/MocA family oxidoreductase [Paenibacillus nasutitermitis]GGD49525.1 dehydrogenase [Paenibacillus nasutitermitis]